MLYRVQQFINALFPHIDPSSIQWALNHLSPEASELFLQQSKAEQRHAIDVAESIIKAKHPSSFHDLQNLITAALLHDCGKSIVSIHLWHRVYIVLIKRMPRIIWSHLESGHSFLAFPLKIDARHALWGECLAQKAGLNSMVCRLIREHHTPTTNLGRILAQADNTH